MKRLYAITLLTVLAIIAVSALIRVQMLGRPINGPIKVGFIYMGDVSNGFTHNFVKAQLAMEKHYGQNVETEVKYNVAPDQAESALEELVNGGCRLVIANSDTYEEVVKDMARRYPEVEFCQATGDNANTSPVLDNYHTFMGHIYEGRYLSGVLAGLKLLELQEAGEAGISPLVGYVAAFAVPEVVSGYSAFYLGLRSVVPEAVMLVKYTGSWSDFQREKNAAKVLIAKGCLVISQHADTAGPAMACEEDEKQIYHISYNTSTQSVAPASYLGGSRILWEPYIMEAVGAVLSGRDIEDALGEDVQIWGQDAGAGLSAGWVAMLPPNEALMPAGAHDVLRRVEKELIQGQLQVFQGEYRGLSLEDGRSLIDLRQPYQENAHQSSPSFFYLLDGVIIIN